MSKTVEFDLSSVTQEVEIDWMCLGCGTYFHEDISTCVRCNGWVHADSHLPDTDGCIRLEVIVRNLGVAIGYYSPWKGFEPDIRLWNTETPFDVVYWRLFEELPLVD